MQHHLILIYLFSSFIGTEGQLINNAINKALEEADKIGIKGKDVTPFILSAVAKITAGKSLETSEC